MRERLGAIVFAMLAIACGAEAVRDPSVAITPIDVGTLRFERDAGATRERDAHVAGPALVHFWATWCVPCRRELPALRAAARDVGVEGRVFAVSTDASWEPVRAFFSSPIAPQVVREPEGAIARTLGVSTLPDTYLIDADGHATRRIAGARDWSAPGHRAWLAAALGGTHD